MSVQPVFDDVPRIRRVPDRPYEVRAVSRPATAFTGDFFFSTEVDGALWFALGDFAGHGLRAAVFMAMVQEALEEAIHDCSSSDPAEVVAVVDAALREIIPFNRFATLVLGRALADGTIQLVNAGHCPPIIIRAGNDLTLVASNGPVVGIAPRPAWKQEVLILRRGERLLLYTDGVIEAVNEQDEEFGLPRLISMLDVLDGPSPIDSILDAAADHQGGSMIDDASLMLITRR